MSCLKCKDEVDAQRRLKNVYAEVVLMPSGLERNQVYSGVVVPVDSGVTPVRVRPRREPRAERWTSLAARIAGGRRDMRTAWLADLDGRPEDGLSVTTWQQRRYALGFLVASVRFFLRDSFGRLWYPVDWILATRNRRESFTAAPPALLVVYIAEHDGTHTLLTDGWGWVGGCGVAMFALVRWLQRVRGVELAEGTPVEGD
ncbi:hypothetical protein [Streptomyces sp. NPDC012616]|uniref:hypothetical protein n=1 Tax=Streptomyces sp. NPDC012616 TaxID=3364840 RepID=UPI0036EEE62D